MSTNNSREILARRWHVLAKAIAKESAYLEVEEENKILAKKVGK